jgi:predicted ArsR family transcriptional regulator
MRDDAARRIAVLAGTLRRTMYDFVRGRRSPVSREDAAAAVGVSRKLAAFHLDKLEEAGFLKAHYARPPGRGGPGAGRPSKLYEAGDVEVQLSVPERHYDIPAEILLEALETRRPHEDAREAAQRVAYQRGLVLGQQVREGERETPAKAAPSLASVEETLRDYGFEPYADRDGTLRLRNCPFHRLAQRSPAMVCGMNRALIDGLLRGVGDTTTDAVLDPRSGECCVALKSEGSAA